MVSSLGLGSLLGLVSSVSQNFNNVTEYEFIIIVILLVYHMNVTFSLAPAM